MLFERKRWRKTKKITRLVACMEKEKQKRVHVGVEIEARGPTVLGCVGYVEIPNITAHRKPVKYVGAVGAIVQPSAHPTPIRPYAHTPIPFQYNLLLLSIISTYLHTYIHILKYTNILHLFILSLEIKSMVI